MVSKPFVSVGQSIRRKVMKGRSSKQLLSRMAGFVAILGMVGGFLKPSAVLAMAAGGTSKGPVPPMTRYVFMYNH